MSKTITNTYRSAYLSAKTADVVGRELERLAAANSLTPEAVLQEAEQDGSPLHPFFEWDDSQAARQYRLVQAAWLIRTVKVRVETPTEAQEARAFIRVTVAQPEDEEGDESAPPVAKSQYVPLAQALSVEDYRKGMMQDALRELKQFQAKYRVLTELAGVMKEIDRLTAA
jgi:hypothetical protein